MNITGTSLIKLIAVLALCLTSLSWVGWIGLASLLALHDASQTVITAAHVRRNYWLPQLISVVRQLFTVRVWPYYTALFLIVWFGRLPPQDGAQLPVGGLAASRGWSGGKPNGDVHQPSKDGLCSCGRPLGHNKKPSVTKATPPPSAAETTKRVEALKQRTMSPPPSSLPGIGPNARPLPAGLKPNENVPIPAEATAR
jgi:hypothetical protein